VDDQGQVARSRVGSVSVIEWVGVAIGVLALVVSVLRWYSVTGPFADAVAASGLPTGRTAWGAGFLAWFPMLLLALAAALILAPRYGLTIPFVPILWLVCAFAALVLVIIGWVTIGPPDPAALAKVHVRPEDVSAGAGFGLYLGLVLTAGSVVSALIAFRTWKR
jgi:hypothetical protein